ncbi:hypothetical protein DPSP01_010555 [Paraphaeosphaeria sporulosa]
MESSGFDDLLVSLKETLEKLARHPEMETSDRVNLHLDAKSMLKEVLDELREGRPEIETSVRIELQSSAREILLSLAGQLTFSHKGTAWDVIELKTLAEIAEETFNDDVPAPDATGCRSIIESQTSELYTPLKEDEFRLLSISPSENPHAPLVGTLRTTSFFEARYSAISYVWGDASSPEDAQINGHTVQLQRNLASALRYIRTTGALEVCSAIWADAVCINQKDILEKNRQVAIMHHIYSNAALTIAWLGSAQPNIRAAFKAVSRVTDVIRFFETAAEQVALLTSEFDWNDEVLHSVFLGSGPWKGLRIYQEILLSRNLIFMCERDIITARQICVLYDTIWSLARLEDRFLVHCNEMWSNFERISTGNLWRLRPPEERTEKIRMLHWLLIRTEVLQVSDPRDKVYGLVVLAGLQDILKPDYSMPTRLLYMSTCNLLLELEDGLRFLAMARMPTLEHHLAADPHAPSWLPNWHKSSECPDEIMPELYPFEIGGAYKAATSLDGRPKISDSPEGWELAVDGYTVDTVDAVHIANIRTGPTVLDDFYETILFIWDNPKQTVSSLPILQVVCRALIGDMIESDRIHSLDNTSFVQLGMAFVHVLETRYLHCSGLGDDAEPIEKQQRFVKVFESVFPDPTSFENQAKVVCEQFLGSGIDVEQWTPERLENELTCTSASAAMSIETIETKSSQWMRCATRRMSSQAVIRSSKGHFGLAPVDTKVGDQICVLKDCGFPIILRKVPQNVHVGPCFLLGFMDGEIVQMAETGEVEEERFVIY